MAALNPFELLKKDPTRAFDQLKDIAAKARLPYDKDIWLNLAFYADEQYVEWSDDIGTIRRIPRRRGFEFTPRPVANKIMQFVCAEHAMALQARPTVDVLPATDDLIDFSNAGVALSYLRWLTEPQVADFDGELSDAVMWALAGGEGYLKWVYNPRLERPDVMSVSPLDLYVDPYCKRFQHARYIIHSQFMDVEQVFDVYGKEVKPQDVQRADILKTQLLREMGHSPVLTGAIVNELWMKPCRRYPDGLYVVWTAKDLLVEPGPFPYEHKQLPFTQVGAVMRPGTPHYTNAVKYMRSGQMELNKYHAQKIMAREAFVNYKWWIPEELELNSEPDDSPRQILRGHSEGGSLRPEILTPPPLPDNGDGEWIVDELEHTAGVRGVSQGEAPGRVDSARALEMLKTPDTERLAELSRTIKTSISNGFWMLLMLAKQYVKEEQIVQTYSREGLPEVVRFKSENVQPGMRVRVTQTTGLSRNRSERQQQLLELWQNQVITDPETFAELMEVPVSTFSPQIAMDIRLARNENLTMAEGTPIVPNSWDNHGIHLREHNNFRKTEEFLTLPTKVKTMFEAHCDWHDMMEVQQLQKQAMKMAAAQGMVAGAPAPGQEAGGDNGDQENSQESQGEPAAA